MSLRRDFQALPSELRITAAAAGALMLSLVLPWYQKSYFQGGKVVQGNVSALGVFTFVEAAVLLVAFAVLFLVWARSQRKGFHLPGGDGVAITLAGGWALALLVWRLFDKPDIKGIGVTVGIQWGIFGALLAAGALVAAGARVRAAHRPEPPNPAADDVDWVAPDPRPREPRPDRRPRDSTRLTDVLGDRPAWEGEPGEPPRRRRPPDRSEEATARLPPDSSEEATRRLPPDSSEEATRRLPPDSSEEATRRLPPDSSEEATRRLPPDSSEEATRRLPPDLSEEATRRLAPEPSESPDAPTRRFRDDDPRTQRLWDDE